jgi:hypothetical protein
MSLSEAIRANAAIKIEMILKEIWPGTMVIASKDKLNFKVFTCDQEEVYVLCDVLHELSWRQDDAHYFQAHAHRYSTVFQAPCIALSVWKMTEMNAIMLHGVEKEQIKELVQKYKSIRDLEKHPVKVFFKKAYGFLFN